MNNIENIYLDYNPIVQEFTEEKVRVRKSIQGDAAVSGGL